MYNLLNKRFVTVLEKCDKNAIFTRFEKAN